MHNFDLVFTLTIAYIIWRERHIPMINRIKKLKSLAWRIKYIIIIYNKPKYLTS